MQSGHEIKALLSLENTCSVIFVMNYKEKPFDSSAVLGYFTISDFKAIK